METVKGKVHRILVQTGVKRRETYEDIKIVKGISRKASGFAALYLYHCFSNFNSHSNAKEISGTNDLINARMAIPVVIQYAVIGELGIRSCD